MTGVLEGNLQHMRKKEDLDLPLFDFGAMARATNNFSVNNKLGEGGFGPVYKVPINSQSCNFFS
jgi:hypothetical protein